MAIDIRTYHTMVNEHRKGGQGEEEDENEEVGENEEEEIVVYRTPLVTL